MQLYGCLYKHVLQEHPVQVERVFHPGKLWQSGLLSTQGKGTEISVSFGTLKDRNSRARLAKHEGLDNRYKPAGKCYINLRTDRNFVTTTFDDHPLILIRSEIQVIDII